MSSKNESEYTLSETHLDDFGMFRYEMNSVFKLHQFQDEKQSDLFVGGRHPLSRTEAGKQIKDLDDVNKKMEYSDVFRPPGLVRLRHNNYLENQGNASALSSHTGSNPAGQVSNQFDNQEKVQLGNTNMDQRKEELIQRTQKQIWLTIPSKQLYSRIQEESELAVAANRRRFAEIEEQANTMLQQQFRNKEARPVEKKDSAKENKDTQNQREPESKKSRTQSGNASVHDKEHQRLLKVKIDVINANHVNLEQLYQDHLPPETN